jgi:hypothetical protein
MSRKHSGKSLTVWLKCCRLSQGLLSIRFFRTGIWCDTAQEPGITGTCLPVSLYLCTKVYVEVHLQMPKGIFWKNKCHTVRWEAAGLLWGASVCRQGKSHLCWVKSWGWEPWSAGLPLLQCGWRSTLLLVWLANSLTRSHLGVSEFRFWSLVPATPLAGE